MKSNARVNHSDKRFVPLKEKNRTLIVQPKTELCYNCNKNAISPYNVELCDFCFDEIRFTPRTM